MNKESRVFNKTIWFDKNTCDVSFYADLKPKREVQEHPRYNSGEFYSDKCKRNIQYESDLEKNFFLKLEKKKNVIYYWEQPKKAPYWRGRIKSHTIPDVGIIYNDLKVVIVEVKPLVAMLDYKVQMKVEGLLKFCAENGCGFLFTDGKDTLDKIKKVKCNLMLEKQILKAVEDNGVLYKRPCKEIMDSCNATQNELLKIIFKHNLRYKPFPFKLRKENKNKLFHQVFYKKQRYDDLMMERFSTLF